MKKLFVLFGVLIASLFVLLHFRQKPAAPSPTDVSPPELAAPAVEPAPVLPPPAAVAPVAPSVAVQPPPKTILERIAGSDPTVCKLSPEQVQSFLARNRTNAESLLAAYNVTSDKELLRLAGQKFPGNPLVLAAVVVNDVFPENRRAWLDEFNQAAPENPLGNYLAARDYLKSQQPELAWKEIYDATAKSGFQDYTTERLQGLEEMYLDSGRSAAEAKALAMMSLQLPHLMLLRDLGKEMSAIEQQSFAAGDAAAAQTTARLGLALAGNLSGEGSPTLLGQLVGLSVERKFLNGLDPNGSYDFLPQTVSERLGQLQAREKSIREAARFFDPWMKSASEAELIGYFDRMKIYGEAAAVSWAQNRVRDRGP